MAILAPMATWKPFDGKGTRELTYDIISGDVLPTPTGNDRIDVLDGHSELLCQFSTAFAGRDSETDLTDLVFGQLDAASPSEAVVPALRMGVGNVLAVRHGGQVVGTDAVGLVADVSDLAAIRQRAILSEVHDSVGVDGEDAVALVVGRPGVEPTVSGLVEAAEDALDHRIGHTSQPTTSVHTPEVV